MKEEKRPILYVRYNIEYARVSTSVRANRHLHAPPLHGGSSSWEMGNCCGKKGESEVMGKAFDEEEVQEMQDVEEDNTVYEEINPVTKATAVCLCVFKFIFNNFPFNLGLIVEGCCVCST